MSNAKTMTTQLNNPPTSGEYEEIFFDIDGPWRGQNWCYVLFTTTSGDQWVGHFRAENRSGFKIARALKLPTCLQKILLVLFPVDTDILLTSIKKINSQT
jgi:hypothetical protein